MATSGVPQFASLYVGDLSPDVTEAMLYEIFNSVGPVGSIRICRDSVSRRSLGYGYVNFHSVEDAEKALDTLNYSNIKMRACRIMWSQRDPSLRRSGVGNIFVKNLDANIDNKALYDTFSLFGNILSCKVAADPQGKSRGYGFVHYEGEEAAKQAIERVNGMQIGDKTVEVHAFQKRDDRSRPSDTQFTNLYTKNFPAEWDETKLLETFKEYGTITSSVVCEDKKGRKFAFINFEKPEEAQKAIKELHHHDYRTEEQKKEQNSEDDPDTYLMYVVRAQSKAERLRDFKRIANEKSTPGMGPGRSQGVNLYIKNLNESTTDEQLKELFSTFGTITSCKVMKDDKDQCKGFGFVCYNSPDEATKAVTEMHLKVVKGKPLYVGLAEKREVRQERLRQRYTTGATGMGGGPAGGGKGGKGGGKDGKGGMGKMAGGMYGMNGGMGGSGMMGPTGGMMGGMMGGQSMMPNPQMGNMMSKGGVPGGMMAPQMMAGMMGPRGQMGMMGGKGPMGGMMGGPQMMGMMGGKPGMMPQMMNMMGKGGPAAAGMPGPMNPAIMRPLMNPMQTPMRPQNTPQPSPQNQGAGGPLTAAGLAAAPPGVQKQMLGEKLFPAITKYQPELAGKITGMMLEMDNSELLILLESEAQLKLKVDEAMRVLQG